MSHFIRILLSTLMFSFLSYISYAQNIKGRILDHQEHPIVGAIIVVEDAQGKFLQGNTTNSNGYFEINNLANESARLKVSYLSYEDYNYNISDVKKDTNLGDIRMQIKSHLLSEVTVEASFQAVEQREDTLSYNAAAFKTNPDASLEDLIKKMPGMDFSSGSPKAQGEDIARVLVDGKPFFGEDPNVALKNLPAEIVDKVEVYDEKSEEAKFTGFDDGNTSKTVNIVTKPEAKGGWFGKVQVGGGYPDKYAGDGNINYFRGARRISLIAQSNNVNRQNFSSEDLVGISGGGRRGGGGPPFMRRGPESNFMSSSYGGITSTNAVGLNYSDEWTEKMEVNLSYFFNNRNNNLDQSIYRQYIMSEQSGQEYIESNIAESQNFNHSFNGRFEYKYDSLSSILVIPSVSYQNMNSFSELEGTTMSALHSLLNSTKNFSKNEFASLNANTMLMLRHRFAKPGRTISLWGRGGYNNRDGLGYLEAENEYEDADLNHFLDQEFVDYNQGWNMNSNLTYTEPLYKEKVGLQVQYGLRYENGESQRKTHNFDPATDGYTDLEVPLSNEFTTEYITHRAGLTLRYSDSLFNFNIGLNAQHANLINERILPNVYTYNRDFQNLLPFVRFSYKISQGQNLRIFFRSYTDAPSVNQVQDVIDNENPLQLSKGNPNLDQAYQNRMHLSYNYTNLDNFISIFSSISGQFTKNYIGRSTTIAKEDMYVDGVLLAKGAQMRIPMNMDGYYNLNGNVSFSKPIDKIKTNMNINLSAGLTRTPGMLNEEMNFANNSRLGGGIGFSSNISENIDFNINTNLSYNWVVNTLNKQSDQNFYNQSSSLSFNWIFWKGFVFNTDLNHQLYTGLSDGYNQNFVLWNVGLGKKFLKNDRAEVRLTAYDVLNQNNSIARTISEIYTEDVRTNVLQRYFMLSFRYNIRSFSEVSGSKGRGSGAGGAGMRGGRP